MCVEQNEQGGEREEGKERKGRGRSGRAWGAEERIWAFCFPAYFASDINTASKREELSVS